jgi:hypothetical protein
VISGRASSVERLYSIMDQMGSDPANWLPLFERQPSSQLGESGRR